MPSKPPVFRPRGREKRDSRLSDRRRGSSTQRGYDYQWQKFRAALIANDPVRWLTCRGCNTIARDPSLIHIDHIRRLATGGAKYDATNLQPLCPSCHSKKTATETDSSCDRVAMVGRGGRGVRSL